MIKFKKMHGNGNDFIIIENLTKVNALSKSQIVKIGDRNKGIGFLDEETNLFLIDSEIIIVYLILLFENFTVN